MNFKIWVKAWKLQNDFVSLLSKKKNKETNYSLAFTTDEITNIIDF